MPRTETQTGQMTGGDILIQSLLANDVDHIFCVPGESYLAALDSLHDVEEQIKLVICRQEGGAAVMAEAHGKLTGKPGICFVTRGPGATNASIGVHTAHQDSTPMLLLVGDVARDQRDREAFQEVDFHRMFGALAKHVERCDDAGRLAEYVNRSLHIAQQGRPGPVVLTLPEDMLTDVVPQSLPLRCRPAVTEPGSHALKEMIELLGRAEKPLALVGGGGWTPDGVQALRRFIEVQQLPVSAVFRRQDLINNVDEMYVGDLGIAPNPDLAQAVQDSDLLLVIGPRLGEMTSSGFSLFDIPGDGKRIIHIHPGADEIGRLYEPRLGIPANLNAFAGAAERLAPARSEGWPEWTASLRTSYEGWQAGGRCEGPVNLIKVVEHLRDTLPRDCIITNGAGNFASWVHRYHHYRSFPGQLAPTSGAMGYGLPAGIAAAITMPDRRVVTVAGDGDLMMSVQELATAAQYNARLIVLVFNNGMYGTIRMHQEREYPGRTSGTTLANPDFVALAQSFGGKGWLVTDTSDFAPALEEALAHDGLSLIEVQADPDAISPGTTLSALRKA
ncbi:MAG: thiamine pyrophosphate-binding protein [Alphaproteobacteria bacterium]